MIGYVLVATDGSPPSRKAEDLALDLVQPSTGRILALSIVHVTSEEDRGDQLAAAMENVTQFKLRAENRGIPVEGRVLKGPISETIVETAKKENVDLIVLGTHSRHGLAHALLGSTAEKVVRDADRTVVVAK